MWFEHDLEVIGCGIGYCATRCRKCGMMEKNMDSKVI